MTVTQPGSALLTLEQAAERLGTSVRFLRRLRAERRLPFVKLGKHLRIDSRDLEAFVASCREEISTRRR
jgi:excisionase family DNA binding protein